MFSTIGVDHLPQIRRKCCRSEPGAKQERPGVVGVQRGDLMGERQAGDGQETSGVWHCKESWKKTKAEEVVTTIVITRQQGRGGQGERRKVRKTNGDRRRECSSPATLPF